MAEKQPVGVVIAEDSNAQAVFLQQTLKQNGFEVRRGADGAEALKLVRDERPELIISDIEMPGYEFCAAVKSDPELSGIPVILLSTLSDPEDIIRGLWAGA